MVLASLSCLLALVIAVDYTVVSQSPPDLAIADRSLQIITRNRWIDWVKSFNKSYASESETRMRLALWLKQARQVDKHNRRYEKGLESYRQALNWYSDLTDAELVERFCCFSQFDHYESDWSAVDDGEDDDDFEVPDQLDWRQKGIVTSVKDQGSCGACYAFSIVAAVESLYASKKRQLVDLSSQQVIDCVGNDGCRSGTRPSAMNYIIAKGIEKDSSYSYKGRAGSCNYNKESVVFKVKNQKICVDIGEKEMKKLVAKYGPVSAGIVAGRDFQKYTGGIFSTTECEGQEINHSLLVVGYGFEKNEIGKQEDYWIAKNSYGERFGEKGYIRIARNKNNMCKIASRLIWPQ